MAWPTEAIGSLVRRGEASLQTGPFGTQLRASDYVESGIPVINVRNIGFGTLRPEKLEYISAETRDRLPTHVLLDSDIVFGRKGAVERHVFVRREQQGWFQGSDCIRLRISSPRVVARFASYFLLTPSHQRWMVNHCSSASTMASLNQEILGRVEVPVPPVAEQQRIAGILSAYDDLIENCEGRIRVLDEMARTQFRGLLLPDVPHELVEVSELISRGILEVGDGYRAKNSELGSDGLPFARAGNIDGGFHFDDADLLMPGSVVQAGSKVSREGDVVFTSKGTVGRFAKVRGRTPRFVYSPQLCYWRTLRHEVVPANYLYRWMQSRKFMEQVDRVKGSTDMADYVSLTDQRRMKLRLPNAATLARAEVAMAPIDRALGNLIAQRENLRKTRDLLLPRLLSGKLSVNEST